MRFSTCPPAPSAVTKNSGADELGFHFADHFYCHGGKQQRGEHFSRPDRHLYHSCRSSPVGSGRAQRLSDPLNLSGDLNGIREQQLATGDFAGAQVSCRRGRNPAKTAGVEEGTPEAVQSCPHADCNSGRLYDDRSQEHAGAVSAGAGNSTSFLRIGIQPLLRRRCIRECRAVEFQTEYCLHSHHLAQPLGISRTAGIRGRGRSPRTQGDGAVESLWEKIHTELGAVIIQNNFDLPSLRPLGNLEASESFGRVNFVLR